MRKIWFFENTIIRVDNNSRAHWPLVRLTFTSKI